MGIRRLPVGNQPADFGPAVSESDGRVLPATGSLSRSAARLLSSVAVLACLATLVAGCGKEQPPPASAPSVVTVVKVAPRDVPVEFEYVAQTQSSRQVDIRARINGFLERRVYTEGEFVKEGQALFEMDAKPFQAQLDQAQAALTQHQASCEVARVNYERMKELKKGEAVSQKDLDDAKGLYESDAAAVEQAKAAVETAKLNLSYTKIASPVAGISSAAAQPDGAYISTQNSLLTTVVALSPMWVNFSISENEMLLYNDRLSKGLLHPPPDNVYEVQIVLVDGSLFPHTGRITFAEPSFNAQTGTFLVRTSVENPEGKLRPNQHVRVRLRGAVRPKAILVPQRAVHTGSKGQFVWLVDKDDKAERHPVDIGRWHEDQWFIMEGLSAGDRVIVDGDIALEPGAVVSPKDAPAQEEPAPAVEPGTDATLGSGS